MYFRSKAPLYIKYLTRLNMLKKPKQQQLINVIIYGILSSDTVRLSPRQIHVHAEKMLTMQIEAQLEGISGFPASQIEGESLCDNLKVSTPFGLPSGLGERLLNSPYWAIIHS